LTVTQPLDDAAHLRRAIALAEESEARGARPFGAVVVRANGVVVAEAGSVDALDPRDWTAHSEMTALRQASAILRWAELADCTLYASSEPCPMCASAAYWCNMARLVFGAAETSMRVLRGGHARAAGIEIPARQILAAAPRPIEIVGPLLENEALAAHRRFWAQAPRSV
jgi:tRNA(Arg) A34 adenosine deaminase TadA